MAHPGGLTPSDILSGRSPYISSQKGVTLVDEPETIPPSAMDDDDRAASPRQHRASMSGRKLTGRPPINQTNSSTSLSHQLSHLSLRDLTDASGDSHHAHLSKVLAQVVEWLNEEKSKRKRRKMKKSSQQSLQDASDGTPRLEQAADDGEPDLSKLEHILTGFVKGSVMSTPKLGPKSPHILPRRGSIGKMLKRTSVAPVSSDTEFFGDDVLVPNVETDLDNSRTMAYTGGAADADAADAGDRSQKKDQKNWIKFKEDILTITHTLRLKGWRRIPIERGAALEVARLSGALTNAVYVVKPPKELLQVKTETGTSAPPKRSPLQLLLRIYGPQVEHLIDRDDELAILKRLARKKIGPRLLGTFHNGRFEEYLHARTLEAKDLRVPETSKQIAKRMRELHDGIELLEKELDAGPAIFANWDRWVDRCEEVISWLDKQVHALENHEEGSKPKEKYTKYGLICGVDWPMFRKTYDNYRKRLSEESGGRSGIRKKLVFAHNDTQYGNLMRLQPSGESPLLQPSNQHKQLVVIDFEYAGQNTAGLEFANHFTEWCYDYHDPERPWACNAKAYPTREEQYRFVRSYAMHRPQFNPAASATPRFEGREKTNISDFMLDVRAPLGTPAADYEVEEKAREKKQEEQIQQLLHETRLWRIANSAAWVAWGIVQAKVPELDKPSKRSRRERVTEYINDKLHPKSDPLDDEEKALQEASKHDRPETREQEEAHFEGEEDEHEEFDYLAYSQDRAMFFWGDCLQMGLVKEEELPEALKKKIRIVPY